MMTDQSSPDSAGVAAREPHRNEALADWLEQAPRTMFKFGDGEREIVEPSYLLASDVDVLIQMLRAPAQAVRSQPLRDQFERWAETDHRAIEPEQFEDRADDNNQYYQDDSDNSAFIGWKAALSSAERKEADHG